MYMYILSFYPAEVTWCQKIELQYCNPGLLSFGLLRSLQNMQGTSQSDKPTVLQKFQASLTEDSRVCRNTGSAGRILGMLEMPAGRAFITKCLPSKKQTNCICSSMDDVRTGTNWMSCSTSSIQSLPLVTLVCRHPWQTKVPPSSVWPCCWLLS